MPARDPTRTAREVAASFSTMRARPPKLTPELHIAALVEIDRLRAINAELLAALAWALPSAELDVERLGNALAGPSITPGMQADHVEASKELTKARAAIAKAKAA